ncbi:hypothetical protein Tco_0614620 [Tanacetum coccineum]
MSTIEAEYVSLSACCAQVIWMRTQLLDYGYKYNRILMYYDSNSAIAISCNSVQHSKTKHIDIRYHFIKEHVEKGTVGTEYQLADLFTNALPKERFEYLFHRIVNDGEQQLTVTVDGQIIAITEASIRRHLQLADANGISSLPNTKIFDQLTLMGYVSNDDKLTFQKEQPSQVPITEPITDSFTTSHLTQTQINEPSPMPYDSPLSGGHTPGSDEGSKKLNELTELFGEEGQTIGSQAKIYHRKEKGKDDASRERVKTYTRRRSTDSLRDSTTGGLFSTAKEVQGKEHISTNENVAHKLNDKEMARATAREEQEMINFEKALELQKQLDSDTIKRYQTLKKKPVSVAQVRKNMMIYLKNIAGYKRGYFKGMSYDEIRPIFEEEYNKIQTLFKKYTKVERTKTKRIVEETLLQESFKKLRTAKASRSEPIQEQPTEEPKELTEEELKKMLEIVPVEEIKAEALQRRPFTLWSLVKERFRSAEPTKDKERALWVELKRLFKPDKDDVLWKLQRYMYDPLT